MNIKRNNDTTKGELAGKQKKPEPPRIPTVTPDNENGDPGSPAKSASKTKAHK